MMMSFAKILGVLALLLFAVGASAGDATVAEKAANELVSQAWNGDTSAPAKLKAGAEKGDAVYEERYGYYLSDVPQIYCPSPHDDNNGEKQCYSAAGKYADQGVLWYKKAAEQGYAPADVALGDAYMRGSGVDINHQQALLWYKKAADQGYARGESRLGGMYDGYSCPEDCPDIKTDYTKAFELYKKAADQWDLDALQRLGGYYNGAFGGFVHRNKIVSYALFESSSNIGDDVESTDWHLSKAQIKTAKALKQRMSKIGVSAAIAEYLKSIHKSK
jgi:hypothetical protein